MFSTTSFYGNGRKFTTLFEASEFTESHNSRNIVILPPENGNTAADSDIEDINEDEDELFEQAGELEVDEDSEDSDSSESYDEELRRNNGRSTGIRWRKNTEFDQVIQSGDMMKVEDKYPELILESPLDLWKRFITNEMVDVIIHQSKLYAKRDKNRPSFNVSRAH